MFKWSSDRRYRTRVVFLLLASVVVAAGFWQISTSRFGFLPLAFVGSHRPERSSLTAMKGNLYHVQIYSWDEPYKDVREEAVLELVSRGFGLKEMDPLKVNLSRGDSEVIIAGARPVGASVLSTKDDANHVVVYVSGRVPNTPLNYLRWFLSDPEMREQPAF